jgi:hypothetical protein
MARKKAAKHPTLKGLERYSPNVDMQNLTPTARENLAKLAGKGGSKQGLALALLVNQHNQPDPVAGEENE